MSIEEKIKLAFEQFKTSEDIFDMSEAKLFLYPTSIDALDFQQIKKQALQTNQYKSFGFMFDPDFGFFVVVSDSPSWHTDMMVELNKLEFDSLWMAERWLSVNPLRCFVSSVSQHIVQFYKQTADDEVSSNRKIVQKGFFDVRFTF